MMIGLKDLLLEEFLSAVTFEIWLIELNLFGKWLELRLGLRFAHHSLLQCPHITDDHLLRHCWSVSSPADLHRRVCGLYV